MGLFGKSKSKTTKISNELDWQIKHKKTIDTLENKMIKNYSKSRSANTIDNSIKYLKISIEAHNELYSFCMQSREGRDYYNKMWTSVQQAEKLNSELKNFEENYDSLFEKEKTKKKIETFNKTANAKVIKVIEKNPGIANKDLINLFDPIYKNAIQKSLKELESNGEIIKTKVGNSNVYKSVNT